MTASPGPLHLRPRHPYGADGRLWESGKGSSEVAVPSLQSCRPLFVLWKLPVCVQPQARTHSMVISLHWPSKHLHNPAWQSWSSETWAENDAKQGDTSQGQVFPLKMPPDGLGIRNRRTKVEGSGLGVEGLSRGCCHSLRKDDSDASVVWALGTRKHTAFQLWGVSSVVRTAEASGGQRMMQRLS